MNQRIESAVDTSVVTENTAVVQADARPLLRRWSGRLHALFLRSEAIQGYSLLSPTLLVMLFSMCVPFGIMVAVSFFTQRGYEFDTTLTLDAYNETKSITITL